MHRWPSRAVWLLSLAWGCTPEPPAPGTREAPAAEISAPVAEVARAEPGRPAWVGTGTVVDALPEAWPEPLRWIASGGGGTPEFNQVSIEQDLALAHERLGPGGLLLFAGGRGSHGVQVQAGRAGDPLIASLAELFAPRGGRDASYRPTTLPVDAAATLENLRAAIDRGTASEGPPLLLYLAGHGQAGERLADASIELWGQVPLSARELAELLDGRPRPLRVVMTSCFSGGFAELVFTGADASKKPAAPGRCGLFATTAEREASGCDPNPDRAAQEGYGMHFLNALGGRDRAGQPAEIDLDGDGRVSLLEAHARARSASAGIDVPTTTSERWLRAVPRRRGASRGVALPEEDAVISALTRELGLHGEAVGESLRAVEAEMVDASARVVTQGEAEDAAYRRTAAQLLARWPVLDDPWHPEFAAMLASEGPAISAALASSESYLEFLAAGAELAAAQAEQAELLARSAKLERLVRALETRTLAGELAARGGADWRTYEALLACERWVPGEDVKRDQDPR
ncbi:MAG TPA: hypothetical protein VGB85_00895 [Nannocystis sp.]